MARDAGRAEPSPDQRAPAGSDGADSGQGVSQARDGSGSAQTPDLAAYRRKRLSTIVPWTVAAAAAAAALSLALVRPAPPTDRLRVADTRPIPALPIEQRSRPADPLVGQIPRERVGGARERIDMIYADRMAGFRDRRLRGRLR